MLHVCADNEHFPVSLDPETICSTGMIMPLSSDNGFNVVDAGEVLTCIGDLQKLEIGSHVVQLHREIFRLHLYLENLSQICYRLTPAQCEKCNFLRRIISRRKEWETLDVVPVKMRE